MKSLTIVIPALNEEEAIGGTISRCLAARESIRSTAGVSLVEIIVVSDGSNDRTAEIARSFNDVKVIVFEHNRGYGAAIKEGWRQGSGDLLGFLDADGTCDPQFFGPMGRAAISESADVVVGSRLGPDSRMPALRRLGNRIYALLLGFLCGHHVTDTASGMRVVRREALRHLLPLPDGLHFTPAMSARALLNDLRVIEIPMKYHERIGRSKLSVVRDGISFLRAILSGVLCYRPEKIFLTGFAVCVAVSIPLAAYPAEFYFANGRVEEWMIYRFVACFLLGAFGLLLLLATALANQTASLSTRRLEATTFWPGLISDVLHRGTVLGLLIAILLSGALYFLWPGLVELTTTGQVYMHWSRLLGGAFAVFSIGQIVVFAVLFKMVETWQEQRLSRGQSSSAEEMEVHPPVPSGANVR